MCDEAAVGAAAPEDAESPEGQDLAETIERIERLPLAERAAVYARLHGSLVTRLDGADEPRGA